MIFLAALGYISCLLVVRSTPIRVFHADYVGEYISRSLRAFLAKEGTLAQFSCPGAHAQNGVA
jgi:hypothetical protein